MLLNEFFGKQTFGNKQGQKEENDKSQEESLLGEILEYIINNDRLHKECFMPIAEKIYRRPTKECQSSMWMPLAEKGCLGYHKAAELKENPGKLFSKEFRENLCNKIAEHYQSDVIKGVYQLGK